MHEIVKRDYPITGRQVSKEEARELFKDNKFKLELIDQIEGETVGVYSQNNFHDLCEGGHVASTGKVQFFKLIGISGSYWKADRSGTPLQRIAGVAFLNKKDFDAYLQRIKDAKLYDHRRLGQELDLFSFHEYAAGMPFFHHKGTIVFNELIHFSRKLHQKEYQEIRTPIMMNEQLWKTSGHYDNYKENMYFTNVEEMPYCVRPMNCPGAMLVYKQAIHSYKELPLRLAEYGIDHRCELSGVLHGMFRVRAFTMDDAHIFCTTEQIEDEIVGVLDLSHHLYRNFGFEEIKFALSTRPEKSMGSEEQWNIATKALQNALENQKIKYILKEGEGAFYGPKIEMIITDAMGREWQCGTIQVDFFLPKNFEIEYIDSDQSRKTPIVIHRAIYGSIERFFGILLEHYKGHLPFWLSPVQIRVLTITDQQHEYAKNLVDELIKHGLRAELDDHGDQINAQIRRAQNEKIPWMLVVGKKEVENNTITLRHSSGKQEFGLTLEKVLEMANELLAEK
jgi:threonyl-tRNA synthetase